MHQSEVTFRDITLTSASPLLAGSLFSLSWFETAQGASSP
jgi:hypothetical protein